MQRQIGNLGVIQRTKDGYFNATEFLKEWNKNNPTLLRRLDKFWETTNLTELMSEIAKNELNFNSPNFGDLKNALSVTQRGKINGGTWMHPILFIKFAMYLNPAFEYHVIKFAQDEMLHFREEAGDAYKKLATAISYIVPPYEMPKVMSEVGKAINFIIFGKHHKDIRNEYGIENIQRELWAFEIKVADLIEDDFITSYCQLIDYLRKQYKKKKKQSALNDSTPGLPTKLH